MNGVFTPTSNLQHQLPIHDIKFRLSGTISTCLHSQMQQLQPGLSHLTPARQLPLTPHEIPQTPSFKGNDDEHNIPADLQVGAYSTVVYTTKIILALARVSKQQSQPFMVRVEINIAESRAGGQVNSHSAIHLWVQVSANEH